MESSEPQPQMPRRKDLERFRRIRNFREKFSSLSAEKILQIMTDIADFSDHLKKIYSPAVTKNYAIYHDFIGSGTGADIEAEVPGMIYEDFPDENSVENFLKMLAKKYNIEYSQ